MLQNFRGGVAERLGIDYERVRARRPDIVFGYMNTFGSIGPYAMRPGHEQIGQAVTGMQVRYGSAKPATAPFAANDYGTGLMACYGVALALLHRRRTGEGQFVDSALAYTATMLQSALLQGYRGKEWNEPHGQEARGSGPLDRMYEVADGWVYLVAKREEIARVWDFRDIGSRSGDELERWMEERMRSRSVPEWLKVLGRAGIARASRRSEPARADGRSAHEGARPRRHARSRRLRTDHHHRTRRRDSRARRSQSAGRPPSRDRMRRACSRRSA